MLRKTFLIGILLGGLSTSSLASFPTLTSFPNLAYFSTLPSFYYLGVGAGPVMANISEDAYVRQFSGGRLSFNVKNRSDLSATGIFGTLFGGYAVKTQLNSKVKLYLAGELNADLSSLEHDGLNYEFVHKNFSQTQIKMKDSFGISFLPGFFIARNAVFYGRLGYAYGQFKISSTDVSIGNLNKNLNGFRWGLGLQQSVLTNVALRVEFSETYFTRAHTYTVDTASSTTKYTSFKPNKGQVEFGIFFTSCPLFI